MTVRIEKSKACGSVTAPPSKSAAHRALICAALGGRMIRVNNISFSDDINATLGCLEKMGAKVERGDDFVILGGLNPFATPPCELYCGESGSTLRFLIPLCMLSQNTITLTGSERLFSRNLDVYRDLAEQNGILFEHKKDSLTLKGDLKSGNYKVRGDISSQFISGLMFALPLLSGDSVLEITEKFESAPYVAITQQALKNAGIEIENQDRIYKIKGSGRYESCDITVEGDYSNAAFLDGFNLLGGSVEVLGLQENSLQGDKVYKRFYSELKSGVKQFDLTDCPDLAPVMFALSAFMGGAEFTGTARLKIKESDRGTAMAEELKKFGINVTVEENRVIVESGTLNPPRERLFGHNDHRIVMALSLLCSVVGGVIDGAEAVAKSYPDYFEKIKTLGIVINYES